jgi:hypothetical protein
MAAIEDTAIVSGLVDAQGRLILSQRDGTTITAGSVVGPQGATGPTGDQTTSVKLPTDPPAAYPIGLSRFYITGESGWPVGYAQIFTVNTTTARAFQFLVAKVTGDYYWRSADDVTANWSAWQKVASTSYVDSVDAARKSYFDGHQMIKGIALGDGANLNNYTTPGFWTQGTNASAATGTNYPRQLAGVLEVRANAEGTGIFVYQRYSCYGSYNPLTYQRTLYNGTWSAWAAVSVMDTEFTPTGASNFNYLGGTIRLVTLPSLKRLAFLHFTLRREVSNYGTLSTTAWTNIGSVIPSGARFTPAYTTYINGWISTGSNALPISVYIDYSGGGMSFKGMMGGTTTINLNDIITINATMVES